MRADRKTKGFFSIDRGAFRCAAVGGLNSAVAYLVMARGTGPDNRTTQWSVNAITAQLRNQHQLVAVLRFRCIRRGKASTCSRAAASPPRTPRP
jgi:hypothetical protein